MLTVHDPEKALASLPSPLLAADTLYLAKEPEIQTVKLTAGLHRQTWVNGANIFIDIHVANNTARSLKKIGGNLICVVIASLFYRYSRFS